MGFLCHLAQKKALSYSTCSSDSILFPNQNNEFASQNTITFYVKWSSTISVFFFYFFLLLYLPLFIYSASSFHLIDFPLLVIYQTYMLKEYNMPIYTITVMKRVSDCWLIDLWLRSIFCSTLLRSIFSCYLFLQLLWKFTVSRLIYHACSDMPSIFFIKSCRRR